MLQNRTDGVFLRRILHAASPVLERKEIFSDDTRKLFARILCFLEANDKAHVQ